MVDVTYHVGSSEVASSGPARFLLTNGAGDYLSLGSPNVSNYDGFFVKTSDGYMKTVWDISPDDGSPVQRISIGDSVKRSTTTSTQEFTLTAEGIYVKMQGTFMLTLDTKKLYDETDASREYDIRFERALRDLTLIHVSYKKKDSNYGITLCVATTMDVEDTRAWREVQYTYDDRRGTQCTKWVFDTARCSGKGGVGIAVHENSDVAQQHAIRLLTSSPPDLAMKAKHTAAEIRNHSVYEQLATRALHALRTPSGIMAGLPWFFHEWSRDELTACGGMIATHGYAAVADILDKWYSAIRPDGKMPAIWPDKGLESIDAPGWLGKRTMDLLKVANRDVEHSWLSQERLIRWREGTGNLIDSLALRIRDGLVWNEINTTWMDTSYNDKGREGARIEIQALFLALCDAHAQLCARTKTRASPQRAQLPRVVASAVREKLVIGDTLMDGLHPDGKPDTRVRPNIFIAQHVAPSLFSAQEWSTFFHFALPKLWLAWGGLASLETSAPGFQERYTGENVASYHRGDSWYFVNNIAAMAMYQVNQEDFDAPIRAILDASVRDMVSQGYLGHCSEISSALTQEAAGCHAQAWSASTLLEALLLTQHRAQREPSPVR